MIKDNLAIALAGLVTNMIEFLRLIRNEYLNKEVTKANLTEFLNKLEVKNLDGIAYLTLLESKLEGESKFLVEGYGSWDKRENNVFESIWAIGSGSSDFLEEADRYKYELEGFGATNNYNKALSQNFMLINNLMGRETLTLSTIQKFWGAGYEIIVFEDGKFKKFKELTFIAWNGSYDENKKLNFTPFIILKYSYYKDILTILSTNGQTIEAFGVLEIGKKKEDINTLEIPIPAFDSEHICNCFFIKLDDGRVTTPSLFINKKDGLGKIFLRMTNKGQLEIGVSSKLCEFLDGQIKTNKHR